MRDKGIGFTCFPAEFNTGKLTAFGANFQVSFLNTTRNEGTGWMLFFKTVSAATGAS
jgi:hypothetical protein